VISSRSGLWRALRVLLLIAALLAALAHASGRWPLRLVTTFDLAIGDARLRALMPRTIDSRIAIVDIDEKSLTEIGHWPWGRDRLARLTDELFDRQHAAVVGFDVVFAEPDSSSGLASLETLATRLPALAPQVEALRPELDFDARFARALAGHNVVLGYYLTNFRDARQAGRLPAPVFEVAALKGRSIAFTRWDGYGSNIEALARAAPIAGYFNNVADPDGLVRSVPLISEFEGRHYEPLSLAMFRVYTGGPAVVPGLPTETWLPGSYSGLQNVLLRQGKDEIAIPVDALVQVRVPYRGAGGPRGGSFEYVSASDLLLGRVAADHLKGKLLLVGSSAPGNYDQRATPVDDVYPGVEVHANLLSGLLDGRVPVQPDWASAFEMLQLLAAAGALIFFLPRLKAVRAAQFALLVGVLLVGINLWAFRMHGLLLPLASSMLLAATIYFGITIWGYIVEGRSRRSLARLFGTYVPPELVEEMARDPARYDMRAENRELTVMFCDMRNFTRVSESLSPEDLRALINGFFSSMTLVIRDQRGTLDKYIGDAIMAFWGAPIDDDQHAAHAVRAALAMTQRLKQLNADLRARKVPEIGVGIGLNTGVVCVGDMGSSMRRSYTVMGDAVNLSSRIEGLTRHYGLDVLVGEATRHSAGEGDWHWVEVDRVRVKGKQQAVTLFTPLGGVAPDLRRFEEEMRLWQLALTSYRAQHWDMAQTTLHGLRSAFGDSPLAGLYRQLLDRTTDYCRAPPAPDWDGAHTFDNK